MSLHARIALKRGDFELDVDLEFPTSDVTAVIGASGSGKTTLLRCIAGLEHAAHCEIQFQDQLWQDSQHVVPTHRRPIGYVFQEARLFPHLSVRKNLEFGYKRLESSERKVPFDQAVSLLGLNSLLDRNPRKLSGGERQRVAIARAILCSPLLLLMDEPLASLDIESRAQIMPYFEALQRELQLPIVYVTHAPLEVVRLAARIILLERGKVRAHGPIHEVLTRPDLPLSHFEDAGAVLSARVVAHAPDYHLTYVSVEGGQLAISARPLGIGATTRVFIRARDVSISLVRPARSSISNVLEVKVLDVNADRDPAHRLVRLVAGGSVLLARVTHRSVEELGLSPGFSVWAQVKSVALVE